MCDFCSNKRSSCQTIFADHFAEIPIFYICKFCIAKIRKFLDDYPKFDTDLIRETFGLSNVQRIYLAISRIIEEKIK